MHDTERHEDAMSPDPRLAAALRDALGAIPFDAVEWSRLERRILAGARGRRRPPRWWDVTAGWARTAVAAGVAAAVAAVVTLAVLRGDAVPDAGTASVDVASAGTALFHAATGNAADAELMDAMTGPTRSEWLFAAAVGATTPEEGNRP